MKIENVVGGRKIQVWTSGNALFGFWAVWVSVNGGFQFLAGKCASESEAVEAAVRCSKMGWT